MIAAGLELRIYDDGTGNLNFWENINGRDVVADIDKEGNLSIEGEQITFNKYQELVKESISKRTL
jgi:hypothetical protein